MLNHGDAENVASIVKGLCVGQQDSGEESSKAGGAITIQPDTSLNAIVIRADPTAMNEILSIVQRLDASRAQVLIEGRNRRVTLTDNLSAGIEMAGADSTEECATGVNRTWWGSGRPIGQSW